MNLATNASRWKISLEPNDDDDDDDDNDDNDNDNDDDDDGTLFNSMFVVC